MNSEIGRQQVLPIFRIRYFISPPMYSLSKPERLCSKILIDELLTSKVSFVKYPYRIVVKESSQPGAFPARMAISVSKKRFKRAVKRNRIKRLTREAYRLNKIPFYSTIPSGHTLDILFIYLDHNLPDFLKTEKSVKNALYKISKIYNFSS